MGRKVSSLTVSILILAFAAAIVFNIQKARFADTEEAALPVLPGSVGNWNLLKTIAIPAEFLLMLGTRTASLGEYGGADAGIIQLYILRTKGRRSTIHQPEYCYLGSGKNELLKKGTIEIALSGAVSIPANYFVLQTDQGFQTILYCYTVNSRITNSYYMQQLLLLANGFKNKKVVGSLIRISKNSLTANNDSDLSYLQAFMKELVTEKNIFE